MSRKQDLIKLLAMELSKGFPVAEVAEKIKKLQKMKTEDLETIWRGVSQ